MNKKIDVAGQSLFFVVLCFGVLLGIFWFRATTAPQAVEQDIPADALLGGILTGWLDGMRLLSKIIFILLVIINALFITRIAAGNMLYVSRTFLPMSIFVVVACGIYLTPYNMNGMIASTLFIYGSYYMIMSYRRGIYFDTIFKAGLLLGLMPLFYPISATMWACVGVALPLFRRTWREGVVCCVGLLLPLAVYSYVCWLMGKGFGWPVMQIVDYLLLPESFMPLRMNIGQLVLSCLLISACLLSLGGFASTMRSMRTRPSHICIYFICVMAVGMYTLMLPCRNVMIYPLLAVGAAVVAPLFFVRKTGIVSAALYVAILVCAVAINLVESL